MQETTKNKTATSIDFEKKIGELQRIVDKLESDASISLEESMALYESGLSLTKECVDKLYSVQTRVSDLNRQLDMILQQPLFGDDDD